MCQSNKQINMLLRGIAPLLAVAVFGLLMLRPQPAFAQLSEIFKRGVDVEVRTTEGDGLWLKDLQFQTAHDLTELPATGAPLYTFESQDSTPDFLNVQRIVFGRSEVVIEGSRPEQLECLRLGDIRHAVPPPPDWKDAYGQVPPWSRAQAVADVDDLPYLGQVVFSWAPAAQGSNPYSTDAFLFRQPLSVESPERVIRAILRVAGNADFTQISFNNHPLHSGSPLGFALAEYDVTDFIRGGHNLVAVMCRQLPNAPTRRYGIGFHLELKMMPTGAVAPERRQPAVLLQSEEGDLLRGNIAALQGNLLSLQTDYGDLVFDWDRLLSLNAPYGWVGPEQPNGAFDFLTGSSGQSQLSPLGGAPLRTVPHSLQHSILMRNGGTQQAKPEYLRGEDLMTLGFDGNQILLKTNAIAAIYPPRPEAAVLRRPSASTAPLYCRTHLFTGEVLTGLLRKFDRHEVLIESGAGQIVEADPALVEWIEFPYHCLASGRPATLTSAFGVLPQLPGQEAFRETYENDVKQVKAAVFTLGVQTRDVHHELLAAPDALTPEAWPVLISVDPLGEYLHTLNAEGDARDTILQYLNRGGVLIALSRGGALRSAIRTQPGAQLLRSPLRPSLAELLGLSTVYPDQSAASSVDAFQHPPNTAASLFFQLDGPLALVLQGLPRRINLGAMDTAPFYPMVASQGQGRTVYSLQNSEGKTFGPALTYVGYGSGHIIIIDQLLWESTIDDRPFSERVLPLILLWAAQTVLE